MNLLTTLILCLIAAVTAQKYCGRDFEQAIQCETPCPAGLDSECPSGQRCFGDVTCGGQPHKPQKAECGLGTPCPLKACCSVFGYCGWTTDFCNDQCQSDCEYDVRPETCDTSAPRVQFGYYASWATGRTCYQITPSNLRSATSKYSHLAFSFAFVGEDFHIVPANPDDPKLYREFTGLKAHNSALQTVIAVGGWAFNDPPTQHRFSNMAASPASRKIFIDSVLEFLREYRFDGIDLDWEYPGAPDRGGSPADFENYVSLVREMRAAFEDAPEHFSITMAVPLSNWYLRHFDLPALAEHLDFFNVMSYDLHGVWDGDIPSLGPYVRSHTNMTEIKENMKMFYKNGVPTSKIVLGLGGYGRSWTLEDPSCTSPGCVFVGPGRAGECTAAPGFKGYFEIRQELQKAGLESSVFDEESGSMYFVEGDQWISYDNTDTFNIKKMFAREECLRGTMVWSVDMIDGVDVHGEEDFSDGSGQDGDRGDDEDGDRDGEDDGENDGDDDEEDDKDDDKDDDRDDKDDDGDDDDGDDDDDDPPGGCECRDPNPDQSGALCYPRCEDGWRGVGPLCHKDCPDGYKDIGLFCQKPEGPYGRGAGYAWKFGDPAFKNDGQMKRCEEDHGEGNCEQNGLIVYPKCKKGFWPVGCCLCTPECPDGMTDTGTGCTKPKAKGRGAGEVLPCVKDFFERDLKCVADAIKEVSQVFDLEEAFGGLKDSEDQFKDGACALLQVSTGLSPLLALRQILDECAGSVEYSVYGGIAVEGGFGIAAGGGFGVVLGKDGARGCFGAVCGGVGANVGAGGNVFIGAMNSGDISNLGGATFAVSQDVAGGLGAGWTFHLALPNVSIHALELAVGVGANVNIATVQGCHTDLTPYMEQ